MDNNATMQTQMALGMSNDMPANSPMQSSGIDMDNPYEMDYDNDIRSNIEEHLNNISDTQKAFLVDNLNPTTIALLGIVNGQEVYDYFAEIYQTQLAGNPQQNSGAQPNMASQGAMGETSQNLNQQAKATPAGAIPS